MGMQPTTCSANDLAERHACGPGAGNHFMCRAADLEPKPRAGGSQVDDGEEEDGHHGVAVLHVVLVQLQEHQAHQRGQDDGLDAARGREGEGGGGDRWVGRGRGAGPSSASGTRTMQRHRRLLSFSLSLCSAAAAFATTTTAAAPHRQQLRVAARTGGRCERP